MREVDKYIFDSMKIDEECYLLLCCFLSSNKIVKICSSSSFMHFKSLTIKEEQKIKEYLLSIAIKIRMIDDLMKAHSKNDHISDNNDVGFLITKVGQEKEILEIREACNKIIHTRSLKFVYAKTKNNLSYLKPKVHFFGKKNRDTWKATIDIIKFVEHAVNISNIYDETWGVSGYT